LVAPPIQAATLVIPASVPQEYTLTVVAERIGGDESLNVGLMVGGQQGMLALEGWGNRSNAISMIGGRTGDNNETTVQRPIFRPGAPSTIVCTVRRTSVQVTCDGQPLLNWAGDPRQLSLDTRFWTGIPADKLFLGTWNTSFRISKLDIAPLTQ
jgi:hypothetical protein